MGAVVHASQLMLLSADLSDQRAAGNFRERGAFLLTCVFPVSFCFVGLVVFL